MMDAERFEALCREDCETLRILGKESGIGTYKEKRLHRILKRYVTENEAAYEIPVGRYVADICEGGRVTEIQTRAFGRLLPKLRYYLEQTDLSVTVVCPVIRNKLLIRVDPETGEILRRKMSPSHKDASDLLPCLFGIREVFPSERLKIRLLIIDAEEYRYSERVRYRKTGAYESELFPVTLVSDEEFSSAEELRRFLPESKESFSAAEYGNFIKKKGRDLYSCLNLLCSVGLLDRRKDGKKYIYSVK